MTYSIGVDLHRNYSQVCLLEERGEKIAERRLYHGNEREMRQFFSQYPKGTSVAVEATRGWMWLSDMLEEARLDVHLAHSMGVRLIAESRLKTDKVDAWVLAQLLRTGFLPESYLAPAEVRDRRMLLRHRETLVEARTKMKNRVHGLLARYNIRLQASDIFGSKGMRMLRSLELPAHALRILHDLLDYVEYANGQIKRLEQYLKDVLGSDQRVEWLVTMPGIGRLSAYYLVAEIGKIGRFPSPRSW